MEGKAFLKKKKKVLFICLAICVVWTTGLNRN